MFSRLFRGARRAPTATHRNVRTALFPLSFLSLSLLAPLSGCDLPPEEEEPRPGPVLVYAVDGVEWDVALPLLLDGRLPTFARLAREGQAGYLETLVPTESPALWTTVATGKVPEKHGIHSFVYRDATGEPQLYDSSDRRTKAIWDILSERDLSVGVIGWWLTWPVEPVNGIMVAQTNTRSQIRLGSWKGSLVPAAPRQVYPPAMEGEVMELLAKVEENLPRRARSIFGDLHVGQETLEAELLRRAIWAVRADAAYERVTRRLVTRGERFDVTLVYAGGADVLAHLLWRYREPDVYSNPPTEEAVREYGRMIEDYYVHLDAYLGQILERMPENVTVVVLSDHGMVPTNLRGTFPADGTSLEIRSAAHEEGPPAFLVAAGPGIRPRSEGAAIPGSLEAIPTLGSVVDVTPTLLQLLGLPGARDMDGRILAELLREPWASREIEPVETFDTKEWLAARDASEEAPWHDERVEQLSSLGYVQ